MLRLEGEFEAPRGLLREPRFGFLGDVGGVIVVDHFDRRVRRVSLIEQLEEFDELATAMAILDQGVNSVKRSIPARMLTVPRRTYS